MKIVIYGIGSGRFKVENYLISNCEIVGYSDSFFEGKQFNNKKFYRPKELNNIEYDYIIIAIGEESIFNKVYEDLISWGINCKKIVKFYEIYFIRDYAINLPTYKKQLELLGSNNINGIIMGTSHARDGIETKLLGENFYNFAVGAQDLFYNLKRLEYLEENNYEQIKNLNYVIFDMYTYTYFNFDTSLTSTVSDFYWNSGFTDKESHNFKANKNGGGSTIEGIMKNMKGKVNNYFNFNNLFNNDFKMERKVEEIIKKRITNDEIQQIQLNRIYSGIERNIHKSTINNNIYIFEQILMKLFDINKDIKIYLILIPQYKEQEKRIQDIELKWKISFYSILDKFKEIYRFEVIDLKNNSISNNRNYYYNYGHLNYEGAEKITRLINSYIK